MRNNLEYIVAGFIFGVVVMSGLWLLVPSDSSSRSEGIVDMLIDEWTFAPSSLIALGIPAKVELPDARPGFFPDTVRALSALVEETYKVPKGVVEAQWALESKWGKSNLGASNYFGHHFAATKKYMTDPSYVNLRDLTVLHGQIVPGDSVSFANYQNIRECFLVHGKYLSSSPLYRKAFDFARPERFARELGKRYATDPDYALKLITIMRRYNLE